jgi:hypothetical protein
LLAIFDKLFVFAFVFVKQVRLLCNASPYVRKYVSSVCCLVMLACVRKSLYIEYGVVQRVRFAYVCCVRVVCAGVGVSLCLCMGVVSAVLVWVCAWVSCVRREFCS